MQDENPPQFDDGDDELQSSIFDDDEAERSTFVIKRDLKKRLDVYLQSRLKGISRSKVKQLIDLGGVSVNGQSPKASTVIKAGDRINIILPSPAIRTIQPEEMPLDVLYEDEFFIVLNKQSNLIVHPARGNLCGTLVNGLAWHFKRQVEQAGGQWGEWSTRGFRKSEKTSKSDGTIDLTPDGNVDGLSAVGANDFRPGIIHRLDRNTTGVIVVAKNDEAHWHIAKQFEDRKTLKAYLAVCHNAPDPVDSPGGVIDLPIGKHPTIREAQSIRHDHQGKASVTLYRVRERYENFTLLELELKTGRTHQIRVHLSYIGCPIAGDIIYGGNPIGHDDFAPGHEPATPDIAPGSRRNMTFARSKQEGERLERETAERDDLIIGIPALHAALLRFVHPMTQKEMTFTAPLHPPMANLIHTLREHPAPGTPGPVAKEGYWVDLRKALGA